MKKHPKTVKEIRKKLEKSNKRVRLGGDSLDLTARKVLMASIAYYGLGVSLVDDGTFDEWCDKLATNWHQLDRIRRWQLGGSPDDLRATAHHVRVCWAQIGGLVAWMQHLGVDSSGIHTTIPHDQFNFSRRYQVRWVHPANLIQIRKAEKPKKKRVKLQSQQKANARRAVSGSSRRKRVSLARRK